MTMIEIRKIIRKHAESQDGAYRITQSGEVHYWGQMPNSINRGWYFVSYSAESYARDIQLGRA